MDNPAENEGKVPVPGEPFPDEHPETHFEREDVRWGSHLRDWGYLLVMMLIYLAWTIIIYALEPGIR